MKTSKVTEIPTLPQNVDDKAKKDRAFQISIAKSSYNYMFSYLEPIPISADVPKGEKFTLDYEMKVLEVFLPLLENFEHVLIGLLEKEIASDLPTEAFDSIKEVEAAYEKLKEDMDSHNPFKFIKEISDIKDLLEALSKVPSDLQKAINGLERLPKDLFKLVQGLKTVMQEFKTEGPTAFLKDTIYDTLCTENGRNYLQAESFQDYIDLYKKLPQPLNLHIEEKPWMNPVEQNEICFEDWYFAYMQIAGFNTTNLKAVRASGSMRPKAIELSELLNKIPLTDDSFQSIINNKTETLEDAARKGLLYAVDYAQFEGIEGSELHDLERYPVAPIALFYWNSNPPKGYPSDGALQAVAIQLGQKHDSETTPIFTPNDCTNANDSAGTKWQVAKFIVQNACAIQHESVAHLGACHLTVEPIIVATHRTLAETHPLSVLLKPHFRFTIQINDSALHSLIVPGGVVASVLSTGHDGSAELIVRAYNEWRFDEQFPDRLFAERGLADDDLPSFPFREDTLDIWNSIQTFVADYLKLYYTGVNDEERGVQMQADYELQNWVNELVNGKYAAMKGMSGLKETGNPDQPYKIDDFDYLVKVTSLIIYTASAQHAGVNFAQYPLMSYLPSVSGTLYKKPPNRSEELSKDDYVKWLPPLDVALYQLSFGYLLSGVQFDTLGYYSKNIRHPYFKDPRLETILADFQLKLKQIEVDIHSRNTQRPMAYSLQLPSIIPNSISI